MKAGILIYACPINKYERTKSRQMDIFSDFLCENKIINLLGKLIEIILSSQTKHLIVIPTKNPKKSP